jgi:lipooligosaccharide transport system permease protein
MVLFGAATSWTVVLALPAAVLGGVTIAAPVAAYTVTLDNDLPLAALLRFGITPMFLFSGTFFPISQLPWWLEVLAWVLPLWHAVELCRGLSLGTISVAAVVFHAAYLIAVGVAGVVVATRTYTRRLTP